MLLSYANEYRVHQRDERDNCRGQNQVGDIEEGLTPQEKLVLEINVGIRAALI